MDTASGSGNLWSTSFWGLTEYLSMHLYKLILFSCSSSANHLLPLAGTGQCVLRCAFAFTLCTHSCYDIAMVTDSSKGVLTVKLSFCGLQDFSLWKYLSKLFWKKCDGSWKKNVSIFKKQWTSLLATGSFIPSVSF